MDRADPGGNIAETAAGQRSAGLLSGRRQRGLKARTTNHWIQNSDDRACCGEARGDFVQVFPKKVDG